MQEPHTAEHIWPCPLSREIVENICDDRQGFPFEARTTVEISRVVQSFYYHFHSDTRGECIPGAPTQAQAVTEAPLIITESPVADHPDDFTPARNLTVDGTH